MLKNKFLHFTLSCFVVTVFSAAHASDLRDGYDFSRESPKVYQSTQAWKTKSTVVPEMNSFDDFDVLPSRAVPSRAVDIADPSRDNVYRRGIEPQPLALPPMSRVAPVETRPWGSTPMQSPQIGSAPVKSVRIQPERPALNPTQPVMKNDSYALSPQRQVAMPSANNYTMSNQQLQDAYGSKQAWKGGSSSSLNVPEMPKAHDIGKKIDNSFSQAQMPIRRNSLPSVSMPIDVTATPAFGEYYDVPRSAPPPVIAPRMAVPPVDASPVKVPPVMGAAVMNVPDVYDRGLSKPIKPGLKDNLLPNKKLQEAHGSRQAWKANSTVVPEMAQKDYDNKVEMPESVSARVEPTFMPRHPMDRSASAIERFGHAHSMPPLDSSIQIFDVSGGALSESAVMNRMYGSTPMLPQSSYVDSLYGQALPSNDPSVTIYSLDDTDSGYDMGMTSSDTQGFNKAEMLSGASLVSGGDAAGKIFFKHGSSRLGGGDLRKISNIAERAKFAPVNYITVEGYASRPTQVGSNSTEAHIINLRQALKRSEKVSKELVRQGVPADKIKTVGWGTAKATGNASQDRRVDVVMGER